MRRRREKNFRCPKGAVQTPVVALRMHRANTKAMWLYLHHTVAGLGIACYYDNQQNTSRIRGCFATNDVALSATVAQRAAGRGRRCGVCQVVDTCNNRDYVSPSRWFLRKRVSKAITTTRSAKRNSARSFKKVDEGFLSPEGMHPPQSRSVRTLPVTSSSHHRHSSCEQPVPASGGAGFCLPEIRSGPHCGSAVGRGSDSRGAGSYWAIPRSITDRSMFDH
jgi:hypothetical protein